MFHLKKKRQICGPQINKKQMLAFGHLQGMQLKNEFQYVHIGCTNIINVLQCVAKSSKNEFK